MNRKFQTTKYSLVLSLILISSPFISYAQLYRLNNTQVVKDPSKMEQPVTTAPLPMDTVKLRADTSTIQLNPIKSSIDNAFKEVSSQLVSLTLDMNKNEKKISDYQNILKSKVQLTEQQQLELEELKQLQVKQKDSISNLNRSAQLLAEQLKLKSTEASQILELKKQYRKEYYDQLLDTYKGNKQLLDSNYAQYKREINAKIDSLSPNRWPLYSVNKDTMVREMATIYGQLWAATKEIDRNLTAIMKNFTSMNEKITSFEEISLILKYGNMPDNYIDSLFKARKDLVSGGFVQEKQTNNNFQKQYENYRLQFQSNLAKVQQIWEKNKPQETKQSSDASILANFLQPLNQSSSLVPGIDIFAYKKFSNENVGILGQVKLFLAAPGSDTNKLSHATRLFIPEASQFGMMTDFTFGFIPSGNRNNPDLKLMAINLSLYYLQKQLIATDSTKAIFGTGMLQVRCGMELTLVKNALLIYGNLNGFLLGKGVEQYQKFYTKNSSFRWFGEFGLRSYLNLQSDAKINLLLDLRFIPVGATVGEITGTVDKFIPLFKLGIVKDFAF